MSIFKNTFTDTVRGQLKARGNAFLKRSSNDIIYINGRTSWVRMTSGVDIANDNGATAKANILQGGVYKENTMLSGLGIGAHSYSNNTLNNENLYGLRPMPGITSVDISSKSAYGSIRIATVSFNCWDIKQLELFELLYMRPGYMVLLEWGWLPYIDNDGKIKNNIEFYDIFNNPQTTPLHTHLKNIYNQADKAFGNYEGMLGYIKNFSWTTRPDGGYDCTTEIISTGEILESLRINYPVLFLYPEELKKGKLFINKIDPKYQDNLEKLYRTNIIAGIAGELIFTAYTDTTQNKRDTNNGYDLPIKDSNGFITGYKESEIRLFSLDIKRETEGEIKDRDNGIQPNRCVYIDLESFLNIVTKHVFPENKSNNSSIVALSTRQRNYGNYNGEPLYCLYNPLQISVDPTVCLIRNDKIKDIQNIPLTTDTPNTVLPDFKNDPQQKIKIIQSDIAYNVLSLMIDQLHEKSSNTADEIIKSNIDNYLKTATKYVTKDEAKSFLANAWEEYKFKHIKNYIATDGSGAIIYYIESSKGKNIFQPEYDKLNPEVSENGIAKASFQEYISQELFNEITNNKPINDRLNFLEIGSYFPTPGVDSFAETSIKNEINKNKVGNKAKSLNIDSLKFISNLNKEFSSPNNLGNIGNIYINLNNIIDLSLDEGLESNDVKEKHEINAYDFFKKLINQVQVSIGNLNNFDIHVDMDGIGRIIDINYVNDVQSSKAYEDAFVFVSKDDKFNGLINNVRSYKIGSKIYKEQSNIVAISAQNSGGLMGLDNETLLGFNKGVSNRIIPQSNPITAIKDTSSVVYQSQLIDKLSSSLNYLYEFLVNMNYIEGKITDKERLYKLDDSDKYRNSLKDFIMAFKSLTKYDNNSFRSIIPTTISLELDGIGGLIIGQMFRLPDELLPVGYKGSSLKGVGIESIGRKLGYIVTKIGHRINDSDWVTSIEAQTIILEDNDKSEMDIKNIVSKASVEPETPKTYSNMPNYVTNNTVLDFSKFKYPVTGMLTSKISIRSFGQQEEHRGVDIGAQKGAPVYSSNDGYVVKVGVEGYGDSAVIVKIDKSFYTDDKSTDNYYVVYGHLDTNSVKLGDSVKAGDQIGTVGNKGISTGDHLHYQIRNNLFGYDNQGLSININDYFSEIGYPIVANQPFTKKQ